MAFVLALYIDWNTRFIMTLANTLRSRLETYRNWARLAEQQTGKSALQQSREILALKKMGGQCGISDYYWYKLYDSDYLQGRGHEDYLGWRLHTQFSLALNPRHAVLPAWDKFVFTLIAGESGLPVAPIRACFHRAQHVPNLYGLHLKTKEAVGEFLRDPSNYPLFGKPAFSQQGYGTAYLAGYDSASDSIRQLNGETILVSAFLDRLDQSVDQRFHKPECGYFFQEPLTLAPEIRGVTNWSAICGVRIICLNGPEGVIPIFAAWKVAVPPNQVDNFSHGIYGNLYAYIDVQTGEVGRVLDRFWPEARIIQNHPNTNHPLTGFKLPGWRALLDACDAAGKVFPLMKIHYWDFALTDSGPTMLELNDIGGLDINQSGGRGLLTLEVRNFLKKHGDRSSYPWINAL